MPKRPDRVQLDLNSPRFLARLFNLTKDEQHAVLNTLRKVFQLSWEQLYRDPGLRWEAIASRTGPKGERLYSFRCSRSFRAVGFRDGDLLRVLSLHPDHDSAYR